MSNLQVHTTRISCITKYYTSIQHMLLPIFDLLTKVSEEILNNENIIDIILRFCTIFFLSGGKTFPHNAVHRSAQFE